MEQTPYQRAVQKILDASMHVWEDQSALPGSDACLRDPDCVLAGIANMTEEERDAWQQIHRSEPVEVKF